MSIDEIDPNWEVPTPTPIPEGGWQPEDIGKEVWLLLEYGTIVPDTIMLADDQQGNFIIGPTSEIGGFMARTGHTHSVLAESQLWADQLRKFDEDDDEEGSGPVMFEP